MESSGYRNFTANYIPTCTVHLCTYLWKEVGSTHCFTCHFCLWPTWEVFSFFVLHGICLAVEIELKRGYKNRFQLPPLVSGPLTVVFVLVTGSWLFFPQYLRCGADVRSLGEYAIVAESVKGLIQKCWGFFS
ncbi:hypothetical protein MKX01_017948 [Papaver californicum]|nr:hypothetical protein MKX01_017948 [Papaver californicum]